MGLMSFLKRKWAKHDERLMRGAMRDRARSREFSRPAGMGPAAAILTEEALERDERAAEPPGPGDST